MAQIETWFAQDINNAVKVHYIDGNVFSQDNEGNVVGVRVFDGTDPVTLSGTISANVIRGDGATVAVSGTVSGNEASVVLPQAAYAVPGLISIIIKETDGTQVTTLCAAIGNVYESTTSTVVDPGTIIPSVQALIEDIETAVASIPADYSDLWETLAPAFSTSAAYSVGQYVTYDGGLYKFTSAHAAGSWSSGDVVAANIGNDLSNVLGAIAFLEDALSEDGGEVIQDVTWTTGWYINKTTNAITEGTSPLMITEYIPINPSAIGSITVKNIYTYVYSWTIAFYTSAKVFISAEQATINAKSNLIITSIPNNAAYMIVSHYDYNSGYPASEVEISYTTLGRIIDIESDVSDLKTDVNGITSATASDVGKLLKIKTVTNGKVTEWEFEESVTVDNTLTQAGDAADAKATGDKITGLKNEIIQFTGCKSIQFTHGYYINDAVSVGSTVDLTPNSVDSLAYAIVDVSEGDQITINGTGWTNGRLWAFIDSENKLLSVSASAITGTNLKIIAPENSAKCIINVYVSNYGACYIGETISDIHNSIDAEITDIHDDIKEFTGCKNIQFMAGYYIKDNLSEGETVDLSPLGNGFSTLSCAVIPASYGNHVTINGTGWTDGRLWAFVDSNNKLLSSAGASAVGENLVISAPKNSAKCILNVATATAGRCYFGESLTNLYNNLTYSLLERETQDYFGNIPAKIDFTVGRRSNIYLDGLFADKDFRNKWLRMYCTNSEIKLANESITTEPTTTSTGVDITFSIADKYRDVVVQKTASIRVNGKNTGNGETKYVMIVGDSLIGNGEAASYVYSLLDEDGDYNIVQVGSIESTDSVDPSKTVKHEGRGSWSWATYINPAGESTPQYGKTNAFMHNGELDFDYYCDTYNNGNPIDIAIISLGTNDMGQHGWETASQRESYATAAVSNAKTFLDALLRDCPNCKIALGLPAFGSVTRNNASEDGLIAEMACYSRHMIDAYDNGKYNANITCVAHGAYIDRINGYPHEDITDAQTGRVSRLSTNTVHPYKQGYFQWGMGYYNKIRAFLSGLL